MIVFKWYFTILVTVNLGLFGDFSCYYYYYFLNSYIYLFIYYIIIDNFINLCF